MKIFVAPEYSSLTSDILRAISPDYPILRNYCNKRNIVDLIEIQGAKYVLKRYKKPIFINRIVYSFFRKTKARRAFENGNALLGADIRTPKPVAYIERKQCGLFHDGYFISEYCGLPTLEEDFYHGKFLVDTAERDLLCGDLSTFVLEILRKGMQPLDFNTSNIMYEKVDGHYQFTLIDLNRMKFAKRFSVKESMATFAQIGTYTYDYNRLLVPYCRATGDDLEFCIYNVIKNRRRKNRTKTFFRNLTHLFRR